MRIDTSTRGAATLVLTTLLLSTAVGAADWPQWRGPTRDGIAPKDAELPETLPNQLAQVWRVEVGLGHASPVVVGENVFVHSRVGDDERIRALSLADGRELWSFSVPTPYRRSPAAITHDKGPKATPVADASRVCTLGIAGRLVCLAADSGAVLWQRDFSDRYSKTFPDFGASMSPAIVGGRLVAHVGGDREGALMAFDLATGEVVWAWEGEGPAYTSPVEVEVAGVAQILTQSREHILSVAADSGEELWRTAFTTPYSQNIVTPIVHGSHLVFSGKDRSVFALQAILDARGAWVVQQSWKNEDVPIYMSSPVLHGDLIFGFSDKRKGQFFSLDASTGETLWTTEGREGDNASLILSGDRLVALTTEAELIVADAVGTDFVELARYTVADSATWAHPALLGERILIKDSEHLTLWSFDAP